MLAFLSSRTGKGKGEAYKKRKLCMAVFSYNGTIGRVQSGVKFGG